MGRSVGATVVCIVSEELILKDGRYDSIEGTSEGFKLVS